MIRADVNFPVFSYDSTGATLHHHAGTGWAISATAGSDGLCAWCRVPLKPEEVDTLKEAGRVP